MKGVAGNDEALTRQELFRMFTDEACRDGVLEEFEQKILLNVARFLRLEKEEASGILTGSRERFEQGLLGEDRRFEARALYFRALQTVHTDGKVDPMEEQMLAGLRKMFSITEDEHADFLKTFSPAYEKKSSEENAPVATELPPPAHQPGSTTAHLAARLESNRQQIWFNDHCNWHQVQSRVSDQARQAWRHFIDGILQGNESLMYNGLDMIDDILNVRGQIPMADIMLALAVLRWSRLLLKTRLSGEDIGSARVWPLENLYIRLSIKMGPILISIDELRIREGLEEFGSKVFVYLFEDLCMLLEGCHTQPIPFVFDMLRMLFRVVPKAGVTHRAADLLRLLAESAARQGGSVLVQFIRGCREICGLQPQNHPLVVEAYLALQAIAPDSDQSVKNYHPPISRPSVHQPYEPALQQLNRLISEVACRQEKEHLLTSALANIDLSFLDRTVKGLADDAKKEGFDANLMLDRYVVVMILAELPDYPRPVVAFFSLGDPAGHHEEMKGGWLRILLEKESDNRLRVHPDFPVSPATTMFTLPTDVEGSARLQTALHRSGGAYDVVLVVPSRRSARIWHQVGDLDPSGNLYRVERELLPAGNDTEALCHLDKAICRQPWLSGALVHKGLIAKRSGDLALARKFFEQAIAVQPHDPHALTRMGVLEKNENRIESSEEFLLRSLRILPVQSSAMATIGAGMLSRLASDDSSALPLWDYYIAGLHAHMGDGPDFLEIAEVSNRLDPNLARNARAVPVDTVFYL